MGVRVLVVDDNLLSREGLRFMLTHLEPLAVRLQQLAMTHACAKGRFTERHVRSRLSHRGLLGGPFARRSKAVS
jgi:hypothetical protein